MLLDEFELDSDFPISAKQKARTLEKIQSLHMSEAARETPLFFLFRGECFF